MIAKTSHPLRPSFRGKKKKKPARFVFNGRPKHCRPRFGRSGPRRVEPKPDLLRGRSAAPLGPRSENQAGRGGVLLFPGSSGALPRSLGRAPANKLIAPRQIRGGPKFRTYAVQDRGPFPQPHSRRTSIAPFLGELEHHAWSATLRDMLRQTRQRPLAGPQARAPAAGPLAVPAET